MKSKRLSICYAVPGHNLLTESGPTRNVLSVSEALARWADVTVAFRKIVSNVPECSVKFLELDPLGDRAENPVDDSAVRGTSVSDFLRYLIRLRLFVKQTSSEFDVILEKSWILSGLLTSLYQKMGTPGILVENIVRGWNEPLNNINSLTRYLRYKYAQVMIGRYLRKIPAVIVETDELKEAIQNRWQISADTISVIDLGVDRALFRPADQMKSREQLNFSKTNTIMLYVGVIDPFHDLAVVINTMNSRPKNSLELHLVGNGDLLESYQNMGRGGPAKIYFHGHIPHEMVPKYISAADICLAPYKLDLFHQRKVGYSMLKVQEYLACGRPVISVPNSRLFKLIEHGVTGYLLSNDKSVWCDFIEKFPSREELFVMAKNVQARYQARGWDETARNYLRLCIRVTKTSSGLSRGDSCR